MPPSRVIFVSTPSSGTDVDRLVAACRLVRRPSDPVLDVVAGSDLTEAEWCGSLAVIVQDQADPPIAVRRFESRVGFDPVTTMIRCGGSTSRSDAITLAEDPDPETIMTVIRTLAHRQPEIDHIRNELAVTTRIAEGVQDELGRMDQELQLASIVQREFLPSEISTDLGVKVAALWRPASYVSGDIFDIIELDDEHVGLFLADAVGHGVSAALFTMVICRSLCGVDIGADGKTSVVPPGEALTRLNRFLVSRKGQTTRFATATYIVFNTRTNVARIASAGHPSVVHIPALDAKKTNSREYEATGGLLGVFEDEVFEEHEVHLASGEGLVLHSDGFEQAFPERSDDHHQRRLPNHRYREVIDDLAQIEHPTSMIREVESLLDGHAGSLHQSDDLTMICMRRHVATQQEFIGESRSPRTIMRKAG